MKIKRLWISKYKNILDTTLEFNSDLITLLVGQNGLGKSNLLEAIALIFRSLDSLSKKDDFELWPLLDDNFEYEIEYECKKLAVQISCRKKAGFKVYSKELESEKEFEEIPFQEFDNFRQSFLPDYIIGYYSGENKRIKQILQIYEDVIIKDLKANKGLDKPFRKLFFAQDFHGPLVLIALLLYQANSKDGEFKKAIDRLVNEFVSFSSLKEFGLQLKNPSWYKANNRSHKRQGVDELEGNLQNKKQFPFWGAKGKANKIFNYFYNNNLVYPIYYRADEMFNAPTEVLELDMIDITTAASNILGHFSSPMEFLDAFETLFLIDAVSSIHLKVSSKKEGILYDFAGLSEGEQQLICVLGLILITGREDCLFLLDEPDTHLNPKWQRDYVRLLEEFNLNDDNSHIIVATHSPLIVQSAEKADVILYKKSTDGTVKISNEEELKIHNWRIDQVLASEYFQFESTRPPSLDGYMRLRERILEEGNISEEHQQKLNALENEFGVLPTGETIEEIRSLLLLRSIVKKVND